MLTNFLKDISPKGRVEFSTIGAGGCSVITKEEALSNKTDNIYFIGGVSDKCVGKRASDDDIESVSYIRIDIDVANQSEDELTPEDIVEFCIPDLIEKVKETSFSSWSYVVFSGRGIHFYYCGPSISIDKKSFSNAMDRVLREWDKIMPSEYCSDQACTNIGRIMRLPGTVNQKNGATCSIIEKGQQSSLVSFLPVFAKKEKEEKEEREKKRKVEWEKKVKSYGNLDNDDNIYQLILDIPAYELSQMLLPQFKYTGNRNFLSDTRQGNQYTAFYYSEDKNCIINGGSSHYNWGSATSGWDSFQLVKKFFNWTSRETFTHFKKLINK